MKRKIAIAFAAGLAFTGLWSLGQQNAPPPSAPAFPPISGETSPPSVPSSETTTSQPPVLPAQEAPAQPPVSPADEIPAEDQPEAETPAQEDPDSGDTLLSEVHIDSAPLSDVIRFLADQAELEVTLDPELLPSSGNAAGTPILGRTVSVLLTNVTATDALEQVLDENRLMMVSDPESKTLLVTSIPVDLAEPPEAEIASQHPPEDEVLDSLSIGSMPVLEAVSLLAESARMNFIIDPQILPGSTNAVPTNNLPAMKFYDTTYRQALDAILENNHLIMASDTNTGIARVMRRPPPNEEPLITHVVQLKYANITNMAVLVQGTVGPRSRVSTDPRTSRLVVLATEREMRAVTNLIEQLDTPTQQVLIEAHLFETAKNPRSIKGIDWSGTLEGQNVTFGNGFTTGSTRTESPGAPTTVTLPSGRTVQTRGRQTTETTLLTALGNGGISLDTARGFHPSTAFLNADGLRAVLSFLNTEADTQVLATPKTTVLDNETARLEVTRAFPIFEVTPGAANVPAGATVTYTNLGTILNVTPRIAAKSNVSLKIVPEVSNIDSVDTQVLNGQQNTANVYAIRKIETKVTVPSGHTLVMGGLISDTSNKTYTKVPVLGDLPVLGLLFRRDAKERSKANLVVFVTPTIVEDGDFHRTRTRFLDQPPNQPMIPELEETAWDRGKPHDWTAPVYK